MRQKNYNLNYVSAQQFYGKSQRAMLDDIVEWISRQDNIFVHTITFDYADGEEFGTVYYEAP